MFGVAVEALGYCPAMGTEGARPGAQGTIMAERISLGAQGNQGTTAQAALTKKKARVAPGARAWASLTEGT